MTHPEKVPGQWCQRMLMVIISHSPGKLFAAAHVWIVERTWMIWRCVLPSVSRGLYLAKSSSRRLDRMLSSHLSKTVSALRLNHIASFTHLLIIWLSCSRMPRTRSRVISAGASAGRLAFTHAVSASSDGVVCDRQCKNGQTNPSHLDKCEQVFSKLR